MIFFVKRAGFQRRRKQELQLFQSPLVVGKELWQFFRRSFISDFVAKIGDQSVFFVFGQTEDDAFKKFVHFFGHIDVVA